MMDAPLAGTSVVVTRSRAQAGALVDALSALGAEVLEFPTIARAEPESWDAADEAIRTLAAYDWVVFTSANAVETFVARMEALGVDVSTLAACRVAAVGPATAARCSEHGIEPDYVPDDHRAEGVIDGFAERGVGAGSRVLVPRALEAREILPDTLRERGARVDVAPVYRTVRGAGEPAVLERLAEGSVDVVTFTSPSTFRNFLVLTEGVDLSRLWKRATVASIGPVTSDAIRAQGREVHIEAEEYTAARLAEAIVAHVAGESETTASPSADAAEGDGS